MSRSEYVDDLDTWATIRWRGAVSSAIRGARGQALLREMLIALDGMPIKRLAKNAFADQSGDFCAIGVLGKSRGMDASEFSRLLDMDINDIAKLFGVADALLREIMEENDNGTWRRETHEERWERMREWVNNNLITK